MALLNRGFALLLLSAAVFLAVLTSLTAARPASSQELDTASPSISPTGSPPILATATIDRLAAPPTVEHPTQADEGAELFWLHCQPCHGDRGQGLTADWIAQYPPEDQNCWASGCHGVRIYHDGFVLPTGVPAVIGDGSMQRFDTIGQVYNFVRAAMPFERPGSLSEEEYLAITAFLARAHDAWDGTPLKAENVDLLRFRPTTTESAEDGEHEVSTDLDDEATQSSGAIESLFIWVGAAGLILLAAGGIWLLYRRGQ